MKPVTPIKAIALGATPETCLLTSIPALTDVVQLYEMVAKAAGAFADVPVAAIALNTFHLDLATARQAIEQAQAETGLLCTDVVRFGTENILDAIVK